MFDECIDRLFETDNFISITYESDGITSGNQFELGKMIAQVFQFNVVHAIYHERINS
jgi:hypothetical protein